MNRFRKSITFRTAFVLLVSSLGIAIYIYFHSSGLITEHMDFKGSPDKNGERETVFILPLLSLIIFIIFSLFERNPGILVKSKAPDAVADVKKQLYMMRVLEILALLFINAILVTIYFPKIHYVIPVFISLFAVFIIVYLLKILKK